MRLPDELGVIVDRAIGRGILNKRAENCAVEFELRVIADLDLDELTAIVPPRGYGRD